MTMPSTIPGCHGIKWKPGVSNKVKRNSYNWIVNYYIVIITILGGLLVCVV